MQVLGLINNPHYLYRMTILVAIGNLAPVVSHDVLCNSMLPIVIASSEDKVPNIKFNVAKMLKQLIPLVDNSVWNDVIKPCLLLLCEDGDVDVRYFAKQALSSIEMASSDQDGS
jgi:serine/threonine-protein phosphatase 2A regulatory subunit A